MTVRIPLSAPDITDAEIEVVSAVLRTSRLSLGPELEAFEQALAEYHSVSHAVAVSSGTAGLHLALQVLGIGEGDEVILPSFAFVAVANAVLQLRATPVFAEIDPVYLNLDPNCVERAITPRTRAILVVHTFGVPADMDALQTIARQHNVYLVEDACEAIGARFGDAPEDRRVGSFGDIAILGFYPNKQLTTGEGGAVLCNDAALARRLRSLRNQGRDCSTSGAKDDTAGARAENWLDHIEPGYNYRLSEMACALGRVQLNRLDCMLELRASAAQRYDALLAPIRGLETPRLKLPRRTISWFVYAVRLPARINRDKVRLQLDRCGIASGCYFPPIHFQPAWRAHSSAAISLPFTEEISPRTLALPFFNQIAASQQEEVAEALASALSAQR